VPGSPSSTTTPTDGPAPGVAPTPVSFAYTTIPAPADPLRIVMLGGTSKDDVWAIARNKNGKAVNLDPWIVLHFDGSTWSSGKSTLPMTSFAFGIATLGSTTFAAIGGTMLPLNDPSSKGLTINVPLELLGLNAVGTGVVVRGKQSELDTSGISPLFAFDGTKFEPLEMPSTARAQSVESVWGLSADDRWVARGMAQSKTVGAAYLPLPLVHVTGAAQDSFPDVLAIKVSGVANDDVWAATTTPGMPPTYEIRHFDGTTWTVANTSTLYAGTLVALSKEEVFVQRGPQTWGTSVDPYDADGYLYGSDPDVERYDGSAFVVDTRPGAPERVGPIGRVGKNELWFVNQTTNGTAHTFSIARLAPVGT
jgi:hypothetical protein